MAQMTISKKSYVVGMTTPSSSSHHNERKRWCHHGARRPYASPNFVSTCPQIGGVAAIIKDPDAKSREKKHTSREKATAGGRGGVDDPNRLIATSRHVAAWIPPPAIYYPSGPSRAMCLVESEVGLVLLLRRSGLPPPVCLPVSGHWSFLGSLSPWSLPAFTQFHAPMDPSVPPFFSLSRRPCITAPHRDNSRWANGAGRLHHWPACRAAKWHTHRNCRNPGCPAERTPAHTRALSTHMGC
ncbi:hypothetical protein B0T24DRAFT_355281 [Lasiosphaeria ovina]|uniref:Uncharacterized protein n=1 Tax=Lasiosphaeria ovina TaxID=92902 RepID=A0AAE0K3X9_9PEZI|nr:hypothetical protein B0T24DRAFT_355281 [Lasiosphaeria ovina]